MTAHAWIQEEVDGGPVGIGTFWACSTCGTCGGPVWPRRDEPSRAFIPGPAKDVSMDCQEAQREIRTFALEEIQALRQRWHARTGEHRLYAPLFHAFLFGTPEATNVLPLLRLLRDVEMQQSPHFSKFKGRRMTVKEVREALLEAGFREGELIDPGVPS